jgi:hypothetical protein
MQALVRMAAPFCSAGYVVEIINALNVEGYVMAAFNKRQVSARIGNFRQVDDFALMCIVLLFQKSDMARRIALNQTSRCYILRHHRSGCNHGSGANCQPWQNDRAGTDGRALFNCGFEKLGGVVFAAGKFVVREGDIGADKNIVSDSKTIPKLNATLDRDPIADDHVVFNQNVRADIAGGADLCARKNDDILPDSRARSYIPRSNVCRWVNAGT